MSSNNNDIKKMATPELNTNGWVEWRKYVLKSLDELKVQHTESEDKIEGNREMFLKAVSRLELTVTKEIGELTAEVKVLKTKTTQKAAVYAALIALIPTLAYIVHNIIT